MSKKRPYIIFITLMLSLSGAASQQVALENHPTVRIQGTGPTLAELNETVSQALNFCQVRDFLNGTRNRLLVSEFQSQPHDRIKPVYDIYQATVYDYTHGRSILINGIPFDPNSVISTIANIQPFTNAEELHEAAVIAGIRPGEAVHDGMPPFFARDFPDGSSQRILNIALTSANSSRTALVNMNNRTVESLSGPSTQTLACVAPPAATASASGKGVGTANLIISQNGVALWTFEAIRPSASSGTKGSGIELRNVRYKGKSVLFQAHVPILNVEYERTDTGCGPHYRDWQYDEWPFRCDGTTLAPGFRLCTSPAKTILDPPFVDGGNFAGVAVYIEGSEVVLKSQLSAGWYRYVSEWRFHVNGSLRPRFGFGAVSYKPFCVCQVHHHNVYWRFDFDIVTAGNNLVREFNTPPPHYDEKIYEVRRLKDPAHFRHWEISNTRTRSTYGLFPGSNDGTSDAYGVGDLWVLRWHPNELDDGVSITTGSAAQTRADIDKFLGGEVVRDTDVVLWYGAHFKHDQSHDEGMSHIVGPLISPIRW